MRLLAASVGRAPHAVYVKHHVANKEIRMSRRLVVAILVIPCFVAGIANAQEPTTMTAIAPLATTPIVLDGAIGAGEWDDANWYYFDSTVPTERPGWGSPEEVLTVDDWACSFAVKHDATYVYVLTVVTDDVVQSDSGANQWEDDAMEVYFDTSNFNQNPKDGDERGFQMSYKAEDAGGVGGQGLNVYWEAKAVIGAPGYIIEFRVDKAQTGMATGGYYGFDLSPDDDDDGSGRDNQIWWNAKDGNAWNDEIPWGDIILSPNSIGPPSAPSNLTATPVSSQIISLAWTDNSGNETGFEIQRKEGAGGAYAPVTTVGANMTVYSDTGLNPETTYFYQVRATGASGDSAWSTEASATTPASSLDARRWELYN